MNYVELQTSVYNPYSQSMGINEMHILHREMPFKLTKCWYDL